MALRSPAKSKISPKSNILYFVIILFFDYGAYLEKAAMDCGYGDFTHMGRTGVSVTCSREEGPL